MTRTGSSQYPYFVLGAVGAVAFVAMFSILSGFPDLPAETRIGAATLTGTPTLDDFPLVMVGIGETFDAGAGEATLDEIGSGHVKLAIAAQIHTLALGDSVPVADVTLTLVEIRAEEAGFVVAGAIHACPNSREEQTPACNGKSACSDGVCLALPACEQWPDGPIESEFERDMYCCGGRLSLVACSAQECVVNDEIHELGASFPADDGCNTCECLIGGAVSCTNIHCEQQACETDLDCPQVECIQAPCGYTCEEGVCVSLNSDDEEIA